MDIIELRTLLSDMTVEQFQEFFGTLLGFYIALAFVIFVLCYLAKCLIDFIIFLFRKDKYKNVDYFIVKFYSYISRLRKQVQNAPTYTAYMVYYNRLVGALGLMLDLRIIRPDASAKILDVKCKGDFNG